MEITAGFHMLRTAWQRWSDSQDSPCRPIFYQMYSWVVRLDTRSAVSPCSSNSRISPEVRLGFLLAIVFWVPEALLAQLTTGTIEGTSFGMDGHPPPGGGSSLQTAFVSAPSFTRIHEASSSSHCHTDNTGSPEISRIEQRTPAPRFSSRPGKPHG